MLGNEGFKSVVFASILRNEEKKQIEPKIKREKETVKSRNL